MQVSDILNGNSATMRDRRPTSSHLPSRFLGDLNAIHPYREGNGRSQLSFTAMLSEHAG
jgi:cell filamentation protein